MFGWFKPSCPIDLQSKIWVEDRLTWICERFGTKRVLSAPRVLPTREFFPDPYHGSWDDVVVLFARVCQYMGVNPEQFKLSLFTEEDRPDVLGLYQRSEKGRPIIWILKSLMPDQEAVIATLAHEIAHDLLLGAGLLTGDEMDHEQLTDLLPVVLGMGTFQANTAIKQSSGIMGHLDYWSIRRSGYLTAAVCGYTMGLTEWLRGSTSPSTAYLSADAATALRSAHRYLLKTNDCLVNRDNPSLPIPRPANEHLATIVDGTASRCLYALQSWLDPNPRHSDVMVACLRRKEPEIQVASIELLAGLQAPSTQVINTILDHLHSHDDRVRKTAMTAAAELKVPLNHITGNGDTLQDELFLLLRSPHFGTCIAAAVVLGIHGQDATFAVPNIVTLLVRALSYHDPDVDKLFTSLSQIVGDLKKHFDQNPNLLSEGQHQLIYESLRGKQMLAPKPAALRLRRRQ